MKILRFGAWTMGTLAIVTLGFITLGFLLPSTWEARAERTFPVTAETIFPFLDRAHAWPAWTPSPDTGIEFFGPEQGAGGGFKWDDPGYGKGIFSLTEVEPATRIAYQVEVEGGAIKIEGAMTLVTEGDITRVIWEEAGDFGWNPLLGYLAGRMGTLQGEQLSFALETLAAQLLAEPAEP